MKIREARPWFWILVAALSVVAITALVIAISANNQTIDQKKIAEEAGSHVVAKVGGLSKAVSSANELQAEGKERSEADSRQIKKEVEKAVAAGESELGKVRRRVSSVESALEDQGKKDATLEKQIASLDMQGERLDEELKELKAEVRELSRSANRSSQK